jgi:hypothetical protein
MYAKFFPFKAGLTSSILTIFQLVAYLFLFRSMLRPFRYFIRLLMVRSFWNPVPIVIGQNWGTTISLTLLFN